MGVALYSAPSLLNHSCRPNTLPLFNGRDLLIKAVRDIDPGEQLFITYTETLQLLSERQTELQKGYNFTCACERCLEDINQSPVSDCWYGVIICIYLFQGCSEQLLLMAANGLLFSTVLHSYPVSCRKGSPPLVKTGDGKRASRVEGVG